MRSTLYHVDRVWYCQGHQYLKPRYARERQSTTSRISWNSWSFTKKCNKPAWTWLYMSPFCHSWYLAWCLPSYVIYTYQSETIRIYHDFVQGQGNLTWCQRFAVHNQACWDMDVANLWHEDGFPCTKSWLIIFLLPLPVPITKPLLLLLKTTSKRFLVRKQLQLG